MDTKRFSLAICLLLLVCGSTAKFLHEQKYSDQNCECPKEYPNWNGEKCVQCESYQFWDQALKACQSCNETYIYDWNTHKCVCPDNLPYVQNGRCITCGPR